jgi:membrane protein implicated in regulation of membrane protease activity
MESWWDGLTSLNRGFFVSAAFFSVLSLWQTVGALLGMAGHSHGGGGHEAAHSGGHAGHGHAATLHHGVEGHHHASLAEDRAAFSFVSIRSLIAFGTLFSWAGALYILDGTSPSAAILYAVIWGVVAMFAASYLMFRLLRLQETGNPMLESALGQEATVYIEIPPGGHGQVRVLVGGRVQYLKACSSGGDPLMRGTKVRVMEIKDGNLLDVQVFEGVKGE